MKTTNTKQLTNDLSEQILQNVKKAIEKSPFDKTFRAQVTAVLGNGRYKVKYKGAEYAAKSGVTLSVGTWVTVCAPLF